MSLYKRNYLTVRDICRQQGELYLRRYVLGRCKQLSVYLHQFWQSDYDVPHDHPWDFMSFVVKGHYIEHFADGTSERRGLFSFRYRSAREFHWIEVPEGMEGKTWTIFIGFRVKRVWGFLTPTGWVDNKTYSRLLGFEDE